MAFPWSRSTTRSEVSSAERRRRKLEKRARSDETSQESTQSSKDRLHLRLSWAIGASLILVVVGVLAVGYYQEFYRPPRVWAGQVRDVQFTMGDLVERIRVQQGLTGTVDLTKEPFDYLQRLLNAEILRQEAPRLGIVVTDEIVERALRDQFYPEAQAGQETDPGQLDREFRNNLQIVLARAGLSEGEYRGIVEEQLRLSALYFMLGQGIEDSMEQVEVSWIRLDVRGGVAASDVITRLEIEEFDSVAQSVGVSAGFADSAGYVGWVPRQAFPDFALPLFGDDETGQQPLAVGEISRPVFTTEGIYVIRKLSDAETRALSDRMRAKVNFELVEDWQNQIMRRDTDGGWVKVRFSSDFYAWVADQVQISAPRNQPVER